MASDEEYDGSVTGFRRGRLCALCRYPFRGFVAYRMIWCRKDNYYVCRKCWANNCSARHPDDLTTHGINLVAGGILVLFILGLMVPFAVVAWHDFGLRSTWEALPVTGIASLPDGGTVKVQGVINSTHYVALGGHEARPSGSKWQWVWESDTSFWLDDGTGMARVDCSEYYAIAESIHYDPNTTHVDGSVYCNGQETMVVGIVGNEGGQKIIQMRYIAPAGQSVPGDPGLLAWGVALTAMAFLLLLALAYYALRRRSLHRQVVGDAWPARLPANLLVKDPHAVWFPISPVPMEGTVRVIGLVILGAVAMAYLVLFSGTRAHTAADFSSLALLAVALNTAGAFSAALVTRVSEAPSEIGVHERGILFWHDRQSMRLLARTSLEWDGILIFRGPNNMTDDWTIVPKTGSEIPLSGMTPDDTWKFQAAYEKARAEYATSFSDFPEDSLTTFHEITTMDDTEIEDEFMELEPAGDTALLDELKVDDDTTSFEDPASGDGPDGFTERPGLPDFPTIEEPAETVEMEEAADRTYTEFEELVDEYPEFEELVDEDPGFEELTGEDAPRDRAR